MKLIDDVKNEQCEICLSVLQNNLAAVHLYEKCGFKKVEQSDYSNESGNHHQKMVLK